MEFAMRKFTALAATALALVTLSIAPGMAQSAPDAQVVSARLAVSAACGTPPVDEDACATQLGLFLDLIETLPDNVADIARADLINLLSATSTPDTRALLSIVVTQVAQTFVDPVLRREGLQVATLVQTGQGGIILSAAQASAN